MLLTRLLSAALLCAAIPLAHADFPALGALESAGARVTASVIDLDTGKPIERRNADLRLSPASVTKLVTAAAALETWPADRMFLTRVSATSGVAGNGVLNGDLIIHTEGDSTFDHSALWSLAAQIRAVGVRRVTGDIKVSTAPFGPLGCETKDRCDALEKSSTAYNAPLAAIGADYGNWCIDIKPVTVGVPATITGCGGMALPIAIEGSVNTVASNGRTTYWADRFTVAGQGDVLRVGGDLPQGAPQSLYRAMSNPPLGLGQLLGETLKVVGVEVAGITRVIATAAPANAIEIARVDSLMLKEQLGRMLRFSNNYVADLITLNIGAAATGRAGPLADGSRALSAYMQRVAPQVLPAPLFSGSGLTPENRLSAGELSTMLASVYRDPVRFPALYGGMVVPRQAPYAFLRQGNKDWMERVALKTGTMNEPVSVCGVAGYLRKKDGGWMSFAIIVNGGTGYRHVPLYKSMEAIRKDIEAILATH
ncbi:MAG: D-alanyl-D-alanine carboxypeptidase/D-alanyl-D-alanine-endopeptidase [Pseudomonadota bacterium]